MTKNMFGNLFKPKIEHQDPEVRLAAVKSLTGSNNASSLSRIVLNDVDSRVREQALIQLQQQFSDSDKLDSATAAKLFVLADDSLFKQKLIVQMTDNSDCDEVISNSNDDGILVLFASNSPLTAVRKSATEKISNLDFLRQLQTQNTDKNVLKIVRQKIHTIKAKQKQKQIAEDNLTQICEALERLARIDYDNLTVNRVHLLETRWQEIEDQYKPEFEQRHQQAVQACQQKISAAKEQAALEEYQLAQNQLCQSLCDDLQEQIETLDKGALKLWHSKIDELNQQWQHTCKNFSPDTETNERFHGLNAAAQRLTDTIQTYTEIDKNFTEADSAQQYENLNLFEQKYYTLTKELNWPFSINEPKLHDQIRRHHAEIKSQFKSEQKKLYEKRHEIDKKVTILKSHIRQKNLIKANRLFNYIQNLLSEFPMSLQDQEQAKLTLVSQSLNELRGLNKFVTAPKKESLCEQMEALIQVQIEPEELMLQIKAIQDKWKSLATSDAQADDILWDRFKLAADKAYEPCELYLKELEKSKHSNLESRKKLMDQVESELAQIDWQHVDWKQIQTEYSQNWKKWNAFTPVFFSENKHLQQQFESVMNKIKAKLNDEKNENHAIYDQLIERAVNLAENLDEENIDEGIEQIKRLQVSWKNVGITHFNKSRKQWNKFRKLCDQVFEFKRNKHKALLVEQDQQAASAYKIIDQIKVLKNIEDQNLPASQSDYQNLKDEFEQLDLPENRQEKILKRFKQVCDQYESHLAGLPERSRISSHVQFRRAAQLCCELEFIAMADKNMDKFNTLKAEFETVENIQEKIYTKLLERVNQAEIVIKGEKDYSDQQLEHNEQLLAELAIKLEVLFDLESPDHAKQQRMNYQLQQLQAGLKSALSHQEKLEQLFEYETQWYGVGAINSDRRKELQSRLQVVIKQAET